MKAFTTLLTAAALIAGIGIASAQSSMDKKDAKEATGNQAFCAQVAGSPADCKYATAAACEQDSGKQADAKCIPNPNRGTTGAGQSNN